MKRLITLFLAGIIFLSACGGESPNGESANDAPTETPPEITAEPMPALTPASEPTPEEEFYPHVLTEHPLADGATLIIETEGGAWRTRTGSVLYEDSDEPEYLFMYRYGEHFEISPDLTRIAYLYPLYDHRGGMLNILDVLEREIFMPEIDGIRRYDTDVTDLIWLDDEVMLLIVSHVQGSATAGGSLHYYNTADGSNGLIIPLGDHFQIAILETEDDYLKLTIGVHEGEVNQWKVYFESVPYEAIYELMQNGETLILDIPSFDEME
jgi:hypothetical protein